MPDGKPSALVTGALFVVGMLILVPSGLCTGTMVSIMLAQGGGAMIAMPLLIGGPFVAAGSLFLWLAIKRLRTGRMAAELDTKKTNPPPA